MADQDRHVPAPATPPPTERDPFGTRHKLANLAMVVAALEFEEPVPYTLGLHATRVMALGFLFIGDALGSLVAEARQTREHISAIRASTARRGPKPTTNTP